MKALSKRERSALTSDPVPMLGLAAAIAWVSLVTVEFYERIYRERIERNRESLMALSEDEIKKLASDLEAQIRRNRPLDSKIVDRRQGKILRLRKAQEDLIGQRQITFFLLFLLSITSIGASYAPSWEVAKIGPDQWPLTLIAIDYPLLAIVFLSGFWFLFRMFWFDKQILSLSRAEQGSSALAVCDKCKTSMRLLDSYDMGRWQCPRCGAQKDSRIIRFRPVREGTSLQKN